MSALRVYTPALLAEEWGCSDQTIRNLIDAGKLRGWKLGGRMYRINRDAVEEYECRQAIASEASPEGEPTAPPTDTEPSRGLTSEDRTESRLERMIERPQRPQLVHSGPGERSPRPTR